MPARSRNRTAPSSSRSYRTPDILAELGRRRAGAPRPVLIGFAAESGDPVARGREKLRRKAVDMIVANDITLPDAGFDSESNAATIIGGGPPEDDEVFPLGPKTELASTHPRPRRAPARVRRQARVHPAHLVAQPTG